MSQQPAATVLTLIRQRRMIQLEELLTCLSDLTWNQVFFLIDELSRRELICLRRRGFDYDVRAAS
jgi:hypothetical protein